MSLGASPVGRALEPGWAFLRSLRRRGPAGPDQDAGPGQDAGPRPFVRLRSAARSSLPPAAVALLKRAWHPWSIARAPFDHIEFRALAALLQPGVSVLDAGANIGWYTAFFARRVGPAGKVIAVEPIPETFSLLRWNVRALRLHQVRLAEVAASDVRGTADMELPRYPDGSEDFHLARLIDGAPTEPGTRTQTASGEDDTRRFTVQLVPADEIVGSDRPLSLIKCDVEGHEASFLRGASGLFEDGPAVLIELGGNPGDPTSSGFPARRWLEDRGYRIARIEGGESTGSGAASDAPTVEGIRPGAFEPRGGNHFFLRPAHEARLATAGLLLPVQDQPLSAAAAPAG